MINTCGTYKVLQCKICIAVWTIALLHIHAFGYQWQLYYVPLKGQGFVINMEVKGENVGNSILKEHVNSY
jgi:hypothetical protein